MKKILTNRVYRKILLFYVLFALFYFLVSWAPFISLALNPKELNMLTNEYASKITLQLLLYLFSFIVGTVFYFKLRRDKNWARYLSLFVFICPVYMGRNVLIMNKGLPSTPFSISNLVHFYIPILIIVLVLSDIIGFIKKRGVTGMEEQVK